MDSATNRFFGVWRRQKWRYCIAPKRSVITHIQILSFVGCPQRITRSFGIICYYANNVFLIEANGIKRMKAGQFIAVYLSEREWLPVPVWKSIRSTHGRSLTSVQRSNTVEMGMPVRSVLLF